MVKTNVVHGYAACNKQISIQQDEPLTIAILVMHIIDNDIPTEYDMSQKSTHMAIINGLKSIKQFTRVHINSLYEIRGTRVHSIALY